MKNRYSLAKIFLLIGFLAMDQFVSSQTETGKIWITFEDLSILPNNENGRMVSNSPEFQTYINQYNITKATQILPASKNPELLKVYELECNCNPVELIQTLNNNIKSLKRPELAPEYELLYQPNDYNLAFAVDYALDIINVKNAWDITRGDTSVVIAISDANFDLNSPELVGKYNYAQPNISDPNIHHGTAVAIEAAGNTDNNYGKSSVASKSRLRLYSMGYNALLEACYANVDVINLSWSAGCGMSYYGQSVCDELYNNGVIIVAAAGNGSTCGGPNNYVYPASFNHVIAVTSIGSANNHIPFSGVIHQHNDKVDICAPGYAVPLVAANGWTTVTSGTSFASPIVTGVVGLILAANPCLTVDQVEQILKETAYNIDGLNPTFAGLLGAGRVDAALAVARAKEINTLNLTTEFSFICEKQVGGATVVPTNGIAPFTYQWNNGSTENNIHDIARGVYSVIVNDAFGCHATATVEIAGPVVNYDYSGNIKVNANNFELVDLNNDGIIKIEGALIINENVQFELNNKKLQFGYLNGNNFSGIIINNGATLAIQNHTLIKGISTCNSKWDGIEIKDNVKYYATSFEKSVPSYHSLPGKLIMNNSSIHNARIAIKTTSTIENDSTNILGKFNISNSLFYDNEIGIFAISNTFSNSIKNTVIQSLFVIEDSSLMNVKHIELNHVENIVLVKNGFFGNKKTPVNDARGTAVSATNSSLLITGDTNKDLTESNVKGNDFYNLTKGIDFVVTDFKNKSIQITGSYFNNVSQAIKIDSYANGLIAKNEMYQPSGDANQQSFGIYIGDHNQLIITENTITTQFKEQQNLYGIILNNTNENMVNIYKNGFKGNFTAANYFDGDNLKTSIDCNTYNGESTFDWYINSGKLKNQDGVNAEGLSVVYKNTFSECNAKNSQININPNAESLIYQTTSEYMPSCTSAGVEKALILQNIQQNTCKSLFEKDSIATIDNPVKNNSSDDSTYTSLFPNPSIGYTLVNWNGVNIDKIEVFNTIGELLLHKNVQGQQGTQTINNLAAGTYFVKLSYEDKLLLTEKLIVNY
ncbi:MAG: S8 family serine peptidase [Flavobacteriia bacterium]|nr:S8 family serine peptidase [Flavobacteriia bacterium]